MNSKKKKEIRKLLGAHLQRHRLDILKIPSVRQLSFTSNLDQSKLSKIEKGRVDVRLDTLIEISLTYRLDLKDLFDFHISFWDKELEN